MNEILDDDFRGKITNNSFKFYRDFHNVEEAKSFIKILEDNEILFSADTSEAIIDETIVGTGLLPKAIIKLLPVDFQKVNALIDRHLKDMSFDNFKDHHLNQLDDDELIEILEKPDEWSIENSSISKIILKERGIEMSEEKILNLRQSRLANIRKGKKASRTSLFLYFLAVPLGLFTNIIFTIAGVGMGYYYAYGKSTDIDGNSYYIYDEETQKFGRIILNGGLIFLFIGILLLFEIF